MVRASKKKIKYDIHRFWYVSQFETIANVVLYDLDLDFQGQTFQMAILTSKRRKRRHHY